MSHPYRRYSETETFVSTLILSREAIFLLYFVPAEGGGYHITCLNDKSVEPMHIIRLADGTWQLTGLPALITPLFTEKFSAMVEEHEKRKTEEE